jgi:hypothetical protein
MPLPADAPSAPARSAGLSPLAWLGIILGGVLGIVLVVLIAMVLAVLKDSREHIAAQDAKVTALLRKSAPVLDSAAPLVRQAGPLGRVIAPLFRSARSGVAALRGSGVDVLGAVGTLPSLLRVTQALGVAAIPVVRQLQAVDLAGLLDRSDRLLSEVDRRGLVADASRSARIAPRLLSAQHRLIRLQRTLLRVQRKTLSSQLTALAIQRETLGHIRNIDRRTGGGVPLPGTAAP